MRKTFVVAYDVADAKRLSRIARICGDFGNRLQKSVFICSMNDAELEMLVVRARKCIDKEQDQVVIIRLPPVSENELAVQALGKPYVAEERTAIIV